MALRVEVQTASGRSCRLGQRHTRFREAARVPQGGDLDAATAERLNALNRAFYRDEAAAFRDARRDPWPGWERLLPLLPEPPRTDPLSVLDVGCGHGRFAAFLDERLPDRFERFRYVGVDSSEPLLEAARARRAARCQPLLVRADPLRNGPETALPSGPFSLVVLFGFLHHVPGAALRRRLLSALARRVAPQGLLVFTAWDLASHTRFLRRVVPWEEWNRRAADPLDLTQLEPGDHLLPWGEGREAVRYCHFATPAELEAEVDALPLERLEGWLADGREGRLNRYFALRARG